jgi:hypothetical protein
MLGGMAMAERNRLQPQLLLVVLLLLLLMMMMTRECTENCKHYSITASNVKQQKGS